MTASRQKETEDFLANWDAESEDDDRSVKQPRVPSALNSVVPESPQKNSASSASSTSSFVHESERQTSLQCSSPPPAKMARKETTPTKTPQAKHAKHASGELFVGATADSTNHRNNHHHSHGANAMYGSPKSNVSSVVLQKSITTTSQTPSPPRGQQGLTLSMIEPIVIQGVSAELAQEVAAEISAVRELMREIQEMDSHNMSMLQKTKKSIAETTDALSRALFSSVATTAPEIATTIHLLQKRLDIALEKLALS
eukprot:ANDGO_08087.mRNA.1 hypothetical protein